MMKIQTFAFLQFYALNLLRAYLSRSIFPILCRVNFSISDQILFSEKMPRMGLRGKKTDLWIMIIGFFDQLEVWKIFLIRQVSILERIKLTSNSSLSD